MDARSLRPAKEFAQKFGVKALIYGPPGSGKTPIINSAPRPLLLACEPGLLSMRNSMVPTFQAFTSDLIDEFFKWFSSDTTEVKNFDTIAVDSTSQMAEIYLNAALTGKSKAGNKMHGLAAYGDMATRTIEHLEKLFFMPNKHVYLIAKENVANENGATYKKPQYPGNMLNDSIPYKYDCVLRLAIHNIPGAGQHKAFRCIGSIDEMARNRTGDLMEFEPPDFGALVAKCMKD